MKSSSISIKTKLFLTSFGLILCLGIFYFSNFSKASKILVEQANDIKLAIKNDAVLEREILFIQSGLKYDYDDLSKASFELQKFLEDTMLVLGENQLKTALEKKLSEVQFIKSQNSILRNSIASIQKIISKEPDVVKRECVYDLLYKTSITRKFISIGKDQRTDLSSIKKVIDNRYLNIHLKLYVDAIKNIAQTSNLVFMSGSTALLHSLLKSKEEQIYKSEIKNIQINLFAGVFLFFTVFYLISLIVKEGKVKRAAEALNIKIEKEVQIKTEELAQQNIALNNSIKKLSLKQKDIDQILYAFHHDFKTPIRAIASLSEWLKEELQNDESSEKVNTINSKAHFIGKLYDSMIHLLNLEKMVTEPQEVPEDEFTTYVSNKNIHEDAMVEVLYEPPCTLKVQKKLFYIILDELIDNGIKYNESDKKKVTIVVKELDSAYHVNVIDNGVGIGKEYYEKVFSPFQRLSESKSVEHVGIGLTTVKKAAELMNASIHLNQKVKEGSDFQFQIPKN